MGNRESRPIGIVETDQAAIAAAGLAVDDLEGLLMRLAYSPVVTAEDAMRLGEDLQTVRLGLGVVRKYLQVMRARGWKGERGAG